MKALATLRYLRIAPRKVRLVADLIRGKRAQDARNILRFTPKGAALPISKLLDSALANAKNNLQLDPENLYIAKITVDEGPKFKRWKARARGQAAEIQKKTSHINIALEEIKETAGKKKAVKKSITTKQEKIEEEKITETKGKSKTPKFRPTLETVKPKAQKSVKKIFRRKAV